MRIKVDRAVRFFERNEPVITRVNTYFDAGFSALCVVDLRTAEGASAAVHYTQAHNIPMCIVPGATVNTSDGKLYAVYGVVNRVVVPSGLTFEQLLGMVQAYNGFLCTYPVVPAVVEIEIPQLTVENVIQALASIPNTDPGGRI